MKESEKRKKAKEILSNLFCNAGSWIENGDLTSNMTDDEINEVSMTLDDYIVSICKRYKI